MVTTAMNVVEIITDKRDGKCLEPARIEALIGAYARGEVPDYQMSAFAMAVFFQGMELSETVALTRAMVNSGETMHWSNNRIRVDKHSTGGLGDKVSIPLAPLLAAANLDVPMISGRGLGLTGGTLDKLESIRGLRCELSADEFRYIVNRCGCAIVSASEKLAVADKKLYALRDVTGTIPSIPLITASVLSKKLAAGLDALVLDVKWGSGAFMKSLPNAQALANSLVQVANEFGVRTKALITDMNQPLGRMVGNANEIAESIEILDGKGPADVTELVVELAAELVAMAGLDHDLATARVRVQELIRNGDARQKFEEMIAAQNGDITAMRPVGKSHPVRATESGYVCRINAERIGLAVVEMGGGRKKLGDRVDHSVGVEVLKKVGEQVVVGEIVANVQCDSPAAGLAVELVAMSYGISPEPVSAHPLIVERIS
jgi:pyrimidine-nucleoside phosphorylase